VFDLNALKAAFPSLADVQPIGDPSGQKLVFRATRSGQAVCLKIIQPTGDAGARAERELEAVARLKSDFVPKLIDRGDVNLGGVRHIFIIEEFVAGNRHFGPSHPDSTQGHPEHSVSNSDPWTSAAVDEGG